MKNNKKAQSTFILSLILFAVMVLAAIFSDKGVVTVYEFQEELDQLRVDNGALAQENSRLKEEIQALKSDPHAVEKIARDKLNLVRPDEVVYQILPADPSAAAP